MADVAHASCGTGPGRLAVRPLAAGDGWRALDVHCTLGPHDRVEDEQHQQHSISIVLAGLFSYESGRGRVLLTPGSLLLGNAGAGFRCHHDHGVGDRCLSFQFDAALLDTLTEGGAAAPRALFRHSRVPPIAATLPLWSSLQQLARRSGRSAFCSLVVESLALELVANVLAIDPGIEPRRIAVRDEARVARVVRALEAEPAATHSLATLAQHAAMSRYHFLRCFRRVTGVTPYRYLLNRRLALAAQRLREDSASVLQIATDAGFADLSEFTRRFRGHFGRPPGAWRAQFLHGGKARMLA